MAVEQSPQSAVAHLNLTLEIPVTDSGSSSLQSSQRSSPVGILDSSSTTPTDTHATSSGGGECVASTTYASCPSLPMSQQQHHLNVKFAPLPQLAPRKRRSTAPLGMAARSQLVNRRRRNYPQYYQEPPPPPEPDYATSAHDPMWTEEELAQARARQHAAAEKELRKLEAKAAKRTDEDPLKSFGKMVKGVFRKKGSKKDKKNQGAQEGVAGDPEKQEDGAQVQIDVDEIKIQDVERPSRTGSSSSEDEPRSGSEDAARADTPSSEDLPPQVPPKEESGLPDDKLGIDPALLKALSITSAPGTLEPQPESPEAIAALSASPPLCGAVPPYPSMSPSSSPTDAQGKAF